MRDGSRGAGSARDLIAAARRARRHARADYSKFKVGAALETADGTIVTGCNIENATYGLTLCAERVAMFKALSEGHRRFTRIADVAVRAVPPDSVGVRRQPGGDPREPAGREGPLHARAVAAPAVRRADAGA